MSWNNDHIPEIDISYDTSEAERTLASISAMLDKNGFGDAGRELRIRSARALTAGKRAVDDMADQTTKEVADLMRERQYRQPSYHPGTYAFNHKANNQHMVDRLKDHKDGNKHRIYSDITNKGYNYSQAFEFGLLTKNYPAHHPFQDAANHLGLNQLHGKLDDQVNDAIREGFD